MSRPSGRLAAALPDDMTDNQLYVVTGGAGFIGSHICEALVKRGNHVRVIDNFSTGNRANLAHLGSDVEIIEADLADREPVTRALTGAAVVFHEAAIPSVPRSILEPRLSHRANVEGTFNLLMAAHENGVRRVVYAASSSAYGETETLPKVREHAASAAFTVRCRKALRRILLPGVHESLRSRDGRLAILQRFRSASGTQPRLIPGSSPGSSRLSSMASRR